MLLNNKMLVWVCRGTWLAAVAIFFPFVAISEDRIDHDRLEYCQLAASTLDTHAQMLYEEGSTDVSWDEYKQFSRIDRHFFALATFNNVDRPTLEDFERTVDLLWDKYGEKGAFDFLIQRTAECLREFPL